MAVFAPLIAPYDPLQQDLTEKFAPPSRAHPFGQDELGRDILSRVIYGARISLTAGLAAVAIATVGGDHHRGGDRLPRTLARLGADAADGRAPRLPEHPARHRDRLDARGEPDQRDARHRHRVHPADGAGGALGGDLGARARLHRGRARPRGAGTPRSSSPGCSRTAWPPS